MDIIKVKLIGSDGNTKGRAYTYKTAIPVSVGDHVTADMAGMKKELAVVETGIPASEIEGLNYEIKLIDGIASDEVQADAEEVEIDIQITGEVMPVLEINFEEVKQGLESMLARYSNIVVSEQTLQGCKATQKELAGYRNKIDKYRKDKKKIFTAPITEFEKKCKELIAMVESVETPIKQGISMYDDDRRNAKRKEAEQIREEVLAEVNLNEKYAGMLVIKDIYCNLSANKTAIRNDMRAEAETLLEKQKADDLKRDAIIATIEAQNERLNKKLSVDDFKYILNADLPTIIREVQLKADIIYEAENPIEEPVEEPAVEEIIEKPAEPKPIKTAVYKVRLQGDEDVIKTIVGMAKAKGLDVEILADMVL